MIHPSPFMAVAGPPFGPATAFSSVVTASMECRQRTGLSTPTARFFSHQARLRPLW